MTRFCSRYSGAIRPQTSTHCDGDSASRRTLHVPSCGSCRRGHNHLSVLVAWHWQYVPCEQLALQATPPLPRLRVCICAAARCWVLVGQNAQRERLLFATLRATIRTYSRERRVQGLFAADVLLICAPYSPGRSTAARPGCGRSPVTCSECCDKLQICSARVCRLWSQSRPQLRRITEALIYLSGVE